MSQVMELRATALVWFPGCGIFFAFGEFVVLILNVAGKQPGDGNPKDTLKSYNQFIANLRQPQFDPGNHVPADVHARQLQPRGKVVLRPVLLRP